ncbi:unnamed protein product [Strongylus vulgaris]|uniref:Secreted protein n=1 Tax=Strongylus vulgaris TaxID=40348 RepID=A0A3P7JQC2_STRVU|nr:unnamed protein product [Strongylus vulgaris]
MSCRSQHCFHLFLSLASVIHELVLNTGGDVRKVQIHHSLATENSAGPSVSNTSTHLGGLRRGRFALRGTILEFLVSICRLSSLYD